MGKGIFLGLILFAASAFGSYKELECDPSGEYKSIRAKGYKLTLRPHGGGCSFSITPKEGAEDYRSYDFYPDGQFMSFVSFSSQVDSDRLSRTTGSKSFYFYPDTQKQRLFMDEATGELKITTVNGTEMFFKGSNGLIDEAKTTDLEVEQEPVTANRAGITIRSPKKPMATFPYRTGNTSTANRNVDILLEVGGKSCRLKASKLFNYEVGCRETGPCPCNGALRKMCSLDVSQLAQYSGSDIDGITKKENYGQLTQNYCPALGPVAATANIVELKEDEGPSLAPQKISLPQTTRPSTPSKREVEPNQALQRLESLVSPATKKTQPKKEAPIKEGPSEAIVNTPTDCLQRLQTYFSDSKNKSLINEYIKIQGKIALHRIAWTVMKSSESDTRNIEAVIQDLLLKRDPELHQKFLTGPKLSRNEKLLEAMSALKAESERVSSAQKDFPYTLKYGDVKMVELLVNAEKHNGRSAAGGVMDFTSIIKNSLKPRLGSKVQNIAYGQAQLEKLMEKAKALESRVEEYLRGFDCNTQEQFHSCYREPERAFELSSSLAGSEAVLDAVYEDFFDKKEELKANFKWGTYWLHVK